MQARHIKLFANHYLPVNAYASRSVKLYLKVLSVALGNNISELSTAEMVYNGLYTVEEGKIPFITKKGFSMIGYTKMDLGIAKYHFEIGADNTNFDWA